MATSVEYLMSVLNTSDQWVLESAEIPKNFVLVDRKPLKGRSLVTRITYEDGLVVIRFDGDGAAIAIPFYLLDCQRLPQPEGSDTIVLMWKEGVRGRYGIRRHRLAVLVCPLKRTLRMATEQRARAPAIRRGRVRKHRLVQRLNAAEPSSDSDRKKSSAATAI
jgi:hypothetical protein